MQFKLDLFTLPGPVTRQIREMTIAEHTVSLDPWGAVDLVITIRPKRVDDSVMTSEELAEDYSVTSTTIRRWLVKGIPHFRTPGGRLRFKRLEIEKWRRAMELQQGPLSPSATREAELAEAGRRGREIAWRLNGGRPGTFKRAYAKRIKRTPTPALDTAPDAHSDSDKETQS